MNVKELSPEQRVALCGALTGAYQAISDGVSNKGQKLVKVIEDIAESFSDPEPGEPALITEDDKANLSAILSIMSGYGRDISLSREGEIKDTLRKLCR